MNNDIAKKQKKINPNHWMAKIQKYTFGIDAEDFYRGYCPFFWMTWLAILVSPISLIFLLIKNPICSVNNALQKRYSVKKEKEWNTPLMPPLEVFERISKLDDEYTIHLGMKFKFDVDWLWCATSMNRKEAHRSMIWFEQNPNWRETHLAKALEMLEKRKEITAIKKEKKAKRNTFIRKISNKVSIVASYIFKGLIPILGIAILYGVFKVAIGIPSDTWKIVGQLLVIGFVGALTVKAICLGIKAILSVLPEKAVKLSDYEYCDDVNEKKPNPLIEFFGNVFEKIGNIIIGVFTFIKETIITTYKQECPMIVWGDETGPIEKRDKEK